MADFLNEQEQVDLIKSWWRKNGKSTVFGVVLAAAIIGGWNYWKHHKAQVTNAASISYQVLLKADQSKNDNGVIAQAELIKKTYPSTPYAVLSSLFLAKEDVIAGDLKKAQAELKWAKAHSPDALLPVVNLRYARVLLANKQYKEALALVQKSPKGFEASYLLVKGEVYQAQGNVAKAKESYTQASQSDIKDPGLLALVQMKLNSLPA